MHSLLLTNAQRRASASATVQTPSKNPRGPRQGPSSADLAQPSSFQRPPWTSTRSARGQPAAQLQTHARPEGAGSAQEPLAAGGREDGGERGNVPTAPLAPAVSWCKRRRGGLSHSKRHAAPRSDPRQKHAAPRRGRPTSPRGARHVTERKRPHHKSHCRMQDDPQHHQPEDGPVQGQS